MSGTGNANTRELRVAALGHVDHGKTTLVAALSLLLSKSGRAKAVAYDQIDSAPGNPLCPLAGSASPVRFATSGRDFEVVDCPAHADQVKGLLYGASQWDAALVVLSAADGPMPQTREQLALARRVGVPRVVVFLNKTDMVTDANLIGMVEGEIREELSAAGFDGASSPVVKGSALQALRCGCGEGACAKCAPVLALVDALDSHIPAPVPDGDRPFLFVTEEVIGVPGGGCVARGTVLRGATEAGKRLVVVGAKADASAEVAAFEAEPAGKSRVALAQADGADLVQGTVLAEPGSIAGRGSFRAEIYWLGPAEGGREGAVACGQPFSFSLWGAEVTGTVSLTGDRREIHPGEHADIQVTLDSHAALEEGLRFTVFEGGKAVGAGAVTEIVE